MSRRSHTWRARGQTMGAQKYSLSAFLLLLASAATFARTLSTWAHHCKNLRFSYSVAQVRSSNQVRRRSVFWFEALPLLCLCCSCAQTWFVRARFTDIVLWDGQVHTMIVMLGLLKRVPNGSLLHALMSGD